MLLETDRLTLRAATADDVDNLYELNSDPAVMRYLSNEGPTPRQVIRDKIIPFWLAFYERGDGFGYWVAQTRAGGGFLGWFHLRADTGDGVELGYRLLRSAWGQGYATEGSLALIAAVFTDLGADRVFARTMTVNAGSRRVMEKCGLTLARTYRNQHPGAADIEGAEHGDVEYALTRAQWLARSAGAGGRPPA